MHTKAVQYYVSTECSLRSQKTQNNGAEIIYNSDGEEHPGFDKQLSTFNTRGEEIADTASNPSSSNKNGITEEEKKNLLDNRGRTQALGENIAEVYGIPTKNIEVGQSMITKYGIITHIVHYVYDEDLEMMEEELLSDNSDMNEGIIMNQKIFCSSIICCHKEGYKWCVQRSFWIK